METLEKQNVQPVRTLEEGKTPLEALLAGESTVAQETAVSLESAMQSVNQRWIDVSGWSLEQVHDALASHSRDGWELRRVIEASTGRMVLCLVLREVA